MKLNLWIIFLTLLILWLAGYVFGGFLERKEPAKKKAVVKEYLPPDEEVFYQPLPSEKRPEPNLQPLPTKEKGPAANLQPLPGKETIRVESNIEPLAEEEPKKPQSNYQPLKGKEITRPEKKKGDR